MTTSQKNQAIADKCPGKFKWVPAYSSVYQGTEWHFDNNGNWSRCLNGSIIDDLNAMAVACATIEDQEKLSIALCEVVNICIHERVGLAPEAVWATSHQRADAFGKAMGLWE